METILEIIVCGLLLSLTLLVLSLTRFILKNDQSTS